MASGSGQPQEFVVRLNSQASTKKKYSILKFSDANKVDFTSCGGAKLERENNLKDFKSAHNIDIMPKFGAGSEYGKEQKDEARRRKYGILSRKYNPDAQPWLLKLGSGKQTRRFKGTKEGTISENASYFIFTQCPDGAFEASPIDDWFTFTPQIKYKYLGSEEAEEEFTKRDKTFNYFSVMMQKRLKNIQDDDDDAADAGKGGKKKKKKNKDFMLTEMEEWAILSDDDVSEDSSEASGDEESKRKPKTKKKKKASKREGKVNSDDEAVEESDSVDEGAEVDYMTDSDSDDDTMYDKKDREDSSKYQEKGVEDEDGLRKLMSSEDEEEEEKEGKAEDEEGEDEKKEGDEKRDKKNGSDSDSSSSSDSDSDIEKEDNFSALFLQKKERKTPTPKPAVDEIDSKKSANSSKASKSSSPVPESETRKRKVDMEETVAKKPKMEPSSSTASLVGDNGITEEAVRRYLMRKPMTTIDLLQKFKSKNTGLTKEQIVTTIAKILKKLNPEKSRVKDKLYLFIKKSE